MDLLARIQEVLANTAPPPPPAKPKTTGALPIMNASGDQIGNVIVFDGDEGAAKKRGELMIAALEPLVGKDPILPKVENARPPIAPHTDLARVRSCLSGAFEKAINVITQVDGSMLAGIPIDALKACGLKFVESLVPAHVNGHLAADGKKLSVLVGAGDAAMNARNRVAKPLGEGWKVTLESFDMMEPGDVNFRIERA